MKNKPLSSIFTWICTPQINKPTGYYQIYNSILKIQVINSSSGAIHKLCNAGQGEGGGPAKRYHTVFLLFEFITILTEYVTRGGGGWSKMTHFGVTWTAPKKTRNSVKSKKTSAQDHLKIIKNITSGELKLGSFRAHLCSCMVGS